MASLHLRDVDEVLVRKLHQRAKANGRSAAEEHRRILRDTLIGDSVEAFRKECEEISKRNKNRGGPLAQDLIRELRDADDLDR